MKILNLIFYEEDFKKGIEMSNSLMDDICFEKQLYWSRVFSNKAVFKKCIA